MSSVNERQQDFGKLAKARVTLKEIFGDSAGVIWNTHFTEDIRPYLVGDHLVFIFDNAFGLIKERLGDDMEVKLSEELVSMINTEVKRGIEKWGKVDTTPGVFLNAALEELGEVAHAINHEEGVSVIAQEIAEAMGILTRLFYMVQYGIH